MDVKYYRKIGKSFTILIIVFMILFVINFEKMKKEQNLNLPTYKITQQIEKNNVEVIDLTFKGKEESKLIKEDFMYIAEDIVYLNSKNEKFDKKIVFKDSNGDIFKQIFYDYNKKEFKFEK